MHGLSSGFGISDVVHRVLFDKNPPGWIIWNDSISLYKLPHSTESTFQPWEAGSADAIDAIREIVTHGKYWEDLAVYYAEENHETTVIQDDISCVKSICELPSFEYGLQQTSVLISYLVQLLEDAPFEALRPILERLIADKDQNKQRAAAEFLAGILGGEWHIIFLRALEG